MNIERFFLVLVGVLIGLILSGALALWGRAL